MTHLVSPIGYFKLNVLIKKFPFYSKTISQPEYFSLLYVASAYLHVRGLELYWVLCHSYYHLMDLGIHHRYYDIRHCSVSSRNRQREFKIWGTSKWCIIKHTVSPNKLNYQKILNVNEMKDFGLGCSVPILYWQVIPD